MSKQANRKNLEIHRRVKLEIIKNRNQNINLNLNQNKKMKSKNKQRKTRRINKIIYKNDNMKSY